MIVVILHNPGESINVGEILTIGNGVSLKVTVVHSISKCMVIGGKFEEDYNKIEVEGDLIIDIR